MFLHSFASEFVPRSFCLAVLPRTSGNPEKRYKARYVYACQFPLQMASTTVSMHCALVSRSRRECPTLRTPINAETYVQHGVERGRKIHALDHRGRPSQTLLVQASSSCVNFAHLNKPVFCVLELTKVNNVVFVARMDWPLQHHRGVGREVQKRRRWGNLNGVRGKRSGASWCAETTSLISLCFECSRNSRYVPTARRRDRTHARMKDTT